MVDGRFHGTKNTISFNRQSNPACDLIGLPRFFGPTPRQIRRIRRDNLANLARIANEGESKIQTVSAFRVGPIFLPAGYLRLNNLRYLSCFPASGRRDWTI
jgi:hypothetical protein